MVTVNSGGCDFGGASGDGWLVAVFDGVVVVMDAEERWRRRCHGGVIVVLCDEI